VGGALLARFGIQAVYHYAPLHYLPPIARRGALLSKERLKKAGYSESHFRSTSQRQDITRGFGRFVHLTLDAHPPILQAKLGKGFPHFKIAVPTVDIEQHGYSLCRFNIAKARYFRGAKQEPPESAANGRYYDGLALPIARTKEEIGNLLRLNLGQNMIEVLVRDQLPLSTGTRFTFFHREDLLVAQEIRDVLGSRYALGPDDRLEYQPNPKYQSLVRKAIESSLKDSSWFGNGLEFDRV
jgi:hypothetical protein